MAWRGKASLRGQVSLEYVLIIAFTLVILLPGAFFVYTYARGSANSLESLQYERLGTEVRAAATQALAQGVGSWVTLELNIPESLVSITTTPDGKELLFTYYTAAGVTHSVFFNDFNLTLPGGTPFLDENHTGRAAFRFTAYPGNTVLLKEIVDGKTVTYDCLTTDECEDYNNCTNEWCDDNKTCKVQAKPSDWNARCELQGGGSGYCQAEDCVECVEHAQCGTDDVVATGEFRNKAWDECGVRTEQLWVYRTYTCTGEGECTSTDVEGTEEWLWAGEPFMNSSPNACDYLEGAGEDLYCVDNGVDAPERFTCNSTCLPEFDTDGDGYCIPHDCNNTNENINPGAVETCNGVDDNCDGNVDEGLLTTYYVDQDSDGWGVTENNITACAPDATHVITRGGDCNDYLAGVNPGAVEDCDDTFRRDEDCDGFANRDDDDCCGGECQPCCHSALSYVCDSLGVECTIQSLNGICQPAGVHCAG